MLNKIIPLLFPVLAVIVVALTSGIFPAIADDTEIYQADYDTTSVSARPKVLIVFDDSGSMKTPVDGQRPLYDPTATYTQTFIPGRVYWPTDDSVDGDGIINTNSNYWFTDTTNRCASSYESLNKRGRFTANRARRWVDSDTNAGQVNCTLQCPVVGSIFRESGSNGPGCYTTTTMGTPVEKLVFVRDNDTSGCHVDGLIYVNPEGPSNDGCYQYVTSSDPVVGWINRSNDNDNSCSEGTYLYVNPPGRNNNYDACFEQVDASEFTDVTTVDVWVGAQEEVCMDDTAIPGTWANLISGVHSPAHVECVNDVKDLVDDNGAGQTAGYPQDNVLNGNEYGADVDSTVGWGDQPYVFYTSHYLNYLYHNHTLVTLTRLEIAQEVVSTIIDSNSGVDFGLLEFNYLEGGRVVHRIIQDMSGTQRNNLIDLVEDIEHAGSTPMCESMYEAYNYIAGRSVDYGNSAESGSDANGIKDKLPKDSLAESGGTYISPNTECAFTYIILVTDGLPQNDTGANQRIKTLTGKDCDVYDSADSSEEAENCLPQLTEYMANNDLAPNTSGDQYGITYTIGFTTDQQLLSDAADKGKGKYYQANDVQSLVDAFQGAIVGILSQATTFTSPAIAVDSFNSTRSRDEVFYAMFKPGETVDWVGNIKKLKVRQDDDGNLGVFDANTNTAFDTNTGSLKDTARTFWSVGADGGDVEKGGVGALLAQRDPASRTLYSDTGINDSFEAFSTANFDADALGLSDAVFFSKLDATNESGAFKQLNWARGEDAYDRDGDSDTTEAREWIIGDILHSQPVVLNYGARGSFTTDNPDLRLLVGTNSGFIHLFGSSDGEEDWAFFPKNLAEILPKRRKNAMSNNHVYGMDLTPVTYRYDQNNDGTLDSGAGDKLWAYLGMRRGGHAYYALDLSDPDSPSLLWRIDKETPGFGELGQTWSEPVVTTIPGYVDGNGVHKPVLVFAAGYDTGKDGSGVATPDGEGRGLYIVDAQTGALVWSVTPANNSTTNLSEPGLLHSVPAGVAVLDSNGDQVADRIYFGDTGGNLWRVDLSGNALPTSSQDTWQINKLASFSGGSAASDRRFFNRPDVVRIRLDRSAVDAIIIGTGDRTNPNATDVDNRVYMIHDRETEPYSTVTPTASACLDPAIDYRCRLPLTEDGLYPIVEGTDLDEVALGAADGWRFELPYAGEKSLASPITFGGRVFIPTYTPSDLFSDINSCVPQSGKGRLRVIDIYKGYLGAINLGPIIPDTPALYFSDDSSIFLVLPSTVPDVARAGVIDCKRGVCDIFLGVPPPYGNYWFQEAY